MNYVQFIEQCDVDLRSGQIAACIERLRSINSAKVPREFRLPLANLCRRCGQWAQGFRLLSPLNRWENPAEMSATPAELAEYAVLLMKNGSTQEAITLLKTISYREVPEVPMYLAFCEMHLWNYDSASAYLRHFLSENPNSYQALVARVNLASALIQLERTEEAGPLIDLLMASTTESGTYRLRANCLELRGYLYLQTGDLTKSENDLEEARSILKSQTSDQLFVRKWQAVLLATKTNSATPLIKFRDEALRRQEWENVRDCDQYTLKFAFDRQLFEHLICGTPYDSFRQKVCRHLNQEMPTGEFRYGSLDGPCFDLSTGVLSEGPNLNCGKKIHQMLAVLLKDFYRPVSLGALFNSLFPDEHFNVLTSPGRIHQLVSRTRKFFSDNSLPLAIHSNEPGFMLRIEGSFSFRLNYTRTEVSGAHAQIEKLKQLLPPKDCEFSSVEVSNLLNLSESTARRVLRWGVNNNKLNQRGAGPATRYKIAA